MTNPGALSDDSTNSVEFVTGGKGAPGAVLELPLPPSTNNLFINTKRGRVIAPEYRAWRDEAGWLLKQQRPNKISGPVFLRYEFREGRADLTNLVKAPEDLLVAHGVIEGDGPKIVRHVELLFADVSGVRVTVSPL